MCCRFSALLSDTVHHARFDTSKQVVDIYIYALDVKAIKACHLLGSGYQLARGHNFEIFNITDIIRARRKGIQMKTSLDATMLVIVGR